MALQAYYREELISLAMIATGGFAGSVLHFWINEVCKVLPGTLIGNTLGSFLLGIFMYETISFGQLGRRSRMLIGVGFLGAFTTFSGLALIAVQEPTLFAAVYGAVTLTLGLLAVCAGRTIVYRIHGRC